MEPTVQQLRTFYRLSVSASNMFKPINLVRIDERTSRLILLVGDTIEIEIYENGGYQIND